VINPEIFGMLDYAYKLSDVKLIHENKAKIADCPCPKCNPTAEDIVNKDQDN
jgi:hypothetical protein